jgi:hypothetical protein
MTEILSGPAHVYVYDITSVLKHLGPALNDDASQQAISVFGRDEVIDVFLEKTIHDLQVMSVWNYQPMRYPACLINLFNNQVAAVVELNRLLWMPCELSGCQAMLRRVRNVLWVIAIDPQRIRPLRKTEETHVLH